LEDNDLSNVGMAGRLQAGAAKGDVQLMNRCAVAGCGGAAWTKWLGYDLCKECSEAVWVWNTTTMTADEAAGVLTRIAENLRKHGTRSGPEEPNR
jgi:hypothetical protein